MKHSPEVDRIHWGSDVKAIRVEGIKPGTPRSLPTCSVDDPDATAFFVMVKVGHAELRVAEYQVISIARERWLARLMALACAAEISVKFKVPVSDI